LNNQKIKVVICVLTFNHVDFIEECINSLLAQKTEFKFVIYISDDCSSDGTINILERFSRLYQELILLKVQPKNLGNHGNQMFLYNWAIESDADYIATIEGDDYWLDSMKLQKQVDFMELEENSNVVLTCGNFIEFDQENNKFSCNKFYTSGFSEGEWIHLRSDNLLSDWRTKYLTYLIRMEVFKRLELNKYEYIVDFILIYMIRNHGDIYFNSNIFGVYRRHKGGIFGKKTGIDKFKKERKIYLSIFKNNTNDDWIREKLLKTSKKISRIYYCFTLVQIDFLKNARHPK
jgi:glycosyltransferase involved in cell wall biosynthesis